jgi:hypothetical protein
MKKLAKLIGASMRLTDSRTGLGYDAFITDVNLQWGKVRVQLFDGGPWFEPTCNELKSAGYVAD